MSNGPRKKTMTKERIKKILIANNGLAAVKFITSIRKWMVQNQISKESIKFLVMVTEDELNAASEYIRMANEIVMVPPGKNTNNFANVDVIVECALKNEVDAVYVGWGHASENPELSRRLSEEHVVFIGPSEQAMIASGDKIVSTIIAQSLNIPTINWSGSQISFSGGFDELDMKSLQEMATIKSVEEGLKAIRDLNLEFPIMIKSSEGGGGKGIRRCDKIEEFPQFFKEVLLEVPSSPIFLMKCVENARHIEIQLIGDVYGNVVSLSSRDCTIQRRCQKVIEEAPASVAPAEILLKMEQNAVKFAKYVGYSSAGTIEFLYLPEQNEYYFLELNPRLQVEHPCTEMILNLNIPSIQLQIAQGKEIDGLLNNQRKIEVHCISARITCENPEDRFLPSTGTLKSLSFNSSESTWAYFSLSPGSKVHEFADSQIGHVFAKGKTRDEAILNLQLALRNLEIDSTFPTTLNYLEDLIQNEDFRQNRYNTRWLDKRIERNEKAKLPIEISHLVAICAVAIGSHKIWKCFTNYEKSLKDGKIILPTELRKSADVELMIRGEKHSLKVFQADDKEFLINFLSIEVYQEIRVRLEKLGESRQLAILRNLNNSYEYRLEETEDDFLIKTCGLQLKFNKNYNYDDRILKSPYTGRFLEYKVKNGDYVKPGVTFAQIESMKMVFDVKVKSLAGKLTKIAKEGDLINPGTTLAVLEGEGETVEERVNEGSSENQVLLKNWEKKAFERRESELNFDEKNSCWKGFDYNNGSWLKFDENGEKIEIQHEKYLFEKLIEIEEYFQMGASFDHSVQLIIDKIGDFKKVVDVIYTHKVLQESEGSVIKRICKLLENLDDFMEVLVKISLGLPDFKELRRILDGFLKKVHRLPFSLEITKMSGFLVNCPGFLVVREYSGEVNGKVMTNLKCELEVDRKYERTLEKDLEFWISWIIAILNVAKEKCRSANFVSTKVHLKISVKNFETNGENSLEIAVNKLKRHVRNAEVRELIVEFVSSRNERKTVGFFDNFGEFEINLKPKFSESKGPDNRDLKRKIARQNRTSYVYDYPLLFAKCVFNSFKSDLRYLSEEKYIDFIHGNYLEFVEVTELVVKEDRLEEIGDKRIMEKRGINGSNGCAMVAWVVRIFTPSPNPIEFVLIANDITFQVGSFAIPEHRLFEMASKLARERKIPRVNISCNSGARIGLAKDVLELLKVQLTEDGNDFDYIYIDQKHLPKIENQIEYESIGNRLKLTAVKGGEGEYIGVENLMGSGCIGGETSRAYREIPTYCYVTGRSVGIGAYTARLARRVVQNEEAHLILTGCNALNTLLGKKVYSSNNRLGGVEVMENNGIAHAVVGSDKEGVEKLVEWLMCLPQKKEQFPFYEVFESEIEENEVNVHIDDVKKDVRILIDGNCEKQAIFDKGSFDEICKNWATSIVTGRAKLNGLSVGVIGSQWHSFETEQLADEAIDESHKRAFTRAGQVWYPDSAFKTSQAISDFNREHLPLVIIASLRGFSGGRKDMSDMILTFGAHIIDELSQYNQPVIIYIPEGGELRGGAWAVLDSHVNPGFVHMIADRKSRGGVLEPTAVVEIKVKESKLEEIMDRSEEIDKNDKKNIFKKAAIEFADMHDRCERMRHVGAIEHVVEMKGTRVLFWKILRNEMVKLEMARRYKNSPHFPEISISEALKWINEKLGLTEKNLDQEYENIREYFEKHFVNDVKKQVEESKTRFLDQLQNWKI